VKKVVTLFLEMFELVRVKWAPIAARYNVDLTARVLSRSEDFVAHILDISETGCFASVDHKMEVGSLVGLDFKYSFLKVHAVAIVVRNTKNPAGCGFMFVASTKAERLAIRSLIRRLESDTSKQIKKEAA
jgi:hypothetical protein